MRIPRNRSCRGSVHFYMGEGLCLKGHCTTRFNSKISLFATLFTHIRNIDQVVLWYCGTKNVNDVFPCARQAFFWVCGGIYGNEELLLAAPPGIAFILLLACPFFYALPICVINVELATSLPYAGGLVIWVEEVSATMYLHYVLTSLCATTMRRNTLPCIVSNAFFYQNAV